MGRGGRRARRSGRARRPRRALDLKTVLPKTVFFGTSAFAVPALERLAERGALAAVVTQPDRPAGRGHKLTPTPVKARAAALGLRIFEPANLRGFASELAALAPEVLVVASYGRI
ncbi:MAG: formyltransferase family protein, partial [Candidatus Velthaea sp.]